MSKYVVVAAFQINPLCVRMEPYFLRKHSSLALESPTCSTIWTFFFREEEHYSSAVHIWLIRQILLLHAKFLFLEEVLLLLFAHGIPPI